MRIFSLILLLAASASATADWQLDNANSSLHFMSTKNEHVTETHTFGQLSGSLSDNGALSVTVNLTTVDTGIDIRNQRMRDMLFKVADLPSANLTAQITEDVTKLASGKSLKQTVEATFSINGQSKVMPVEVQVTRLDSGALLATSTKPIVINARDFQLDGGVAALQKIAGLAGISLTVPLTFNVVFVQS